MNAVAACSSSPLAKLNPYLPVLTALRGVAALYVSALHLRHAFPQLEAYLATHMGFWVHLFVERAYLAVDFFFLLSGFILMHVYQKAFSSGLNKTTTLTFLIARLARIYPLHLATLGYLVLLELIKLVMVLKGGAPPTEMAPFTGYYSIGGLISNLFLLQNMPIAGNPTWNPPAWSISAEWAAYCVFPVLLPWVQRLKGKPALAWLLGLLAFFTVAMGVLKQGRLVDFLMWGYLRCLVEFTLGLFLYRLLEVAFEQPSAKKAPLQALVKLGSLPVFLALMLAIMVALGLPVADTALLPLFILLLLSGALASPLTVRWAACKPLHFLGEISYSIYLVHMLVFHTAIKVAKVLLHHDINQGLSLPEQALGLLALIGVSCLVGTLTYYTIEKPMRGRLKNWLNRCFKLA